MHSRQTLVGSSQPRIRTCALLGAVLLALVCSGCGGVKLGTGATSQVLRTVGQSTGEISASADDIARQSRLYGVSQDAFTSVAQNADATSGWTTAQARVVNIYRITKDDKATQVAVSLGCDGLTGKLTSTAEIRESLSGAIEGLFKDQLENLVQSTKDLQENLDRIRRTGTEKDRAAAAWLCYAYQVAP